MEKELIIFDLDGTLTPSKANLEIEMSVALSKLLESKNVAVIGGGSYRQFQEQFVAHLKCPENLLKKLFLFPTCASGFYKYDEKEKEWKKVYEHALKDEEKRKILVSFTKTFQHIRFHPTQNFGDVLEDRNTQITFSALGQKAPLHLKEKWDPDAKKRQKMRKILEKYLPEFEVRIGGTTSVDVTRKGIDKAYGIKQIEKHLGFKKEQMLFIGDRLFKGGNDYPVKATGIECIQVKDPEECVKVIRDILG